MTIEDLKAYGANTEEGLARCMNMENMYLRLVRMIPEDANFEKLYQAVAAGDLAAAFDAAHAIKGAAGNLSLTPVYEPIQKITDLLRTRTEMDYTGLLQEIRKGQEELARICAKD